MLRRLQFLNKRIYSVDGLSMVISPTSTEEWLELIEERDEKQQHGVTAKQSLINLLDKSTKSSALFHVYPKEQ